MPIRPTVRTLRPDAITLALVLLLILASYVLGAGLAPRAAAQRDRLLLAAEPAGAVDVLAARAQAARAQAATPNRDENDMVVVVGRIGAIPNPWPDAHPDYPWYPAQASLFLVDRDTARQFAPHMKKHGKQSNCAFCRRLAEKNAHAIAVVNFVDDAGNILPTDARALLDLRDGQEIVVRGRAELLGGTMLVLHADGVYVGPSTGD